MMMKTIALAAALLCAPAALHAQQPAPPQAPAAPVPDIPRDMRGYQLAFLVRGERFGEEQTPEVQGLMMRHLSYIRRMIEEGAYVTAGPAMDGGEVLGIILLPAATPDAALSIVRADPAVQARHFDVQVHPVLLPGLDAVQVRYPAR
ncbi:YciI family protein [Longimicrobium sp.]|jgi:uncharacterized protein YciI|uniref:YciI family protein n=1 Tax=Longimicrobium sp. TaxID=2029185 RepID=UPI002ED92D00